MSEIRVQMSTKSANCTRIEMRILGPPISFQVLETLCKSSTYIVYLSWRLITGGGLPWPAPGEDGNRLMRKLGGRTICCLEEVVVRLVSVQAFEDEKSLQGMVG